MVPYKSPELVLIRSARFDFELERRDESDVVALTYRCLLQNIRWFVNAVGNYLGKIDVAPQK
jgi:hypothetical protein